MRITATAFCAGFVMDDDGLNVIRCAPILRSIFKRANARTMEEIQALCKHRGWVLHILHEK
jgi:hypothetical protein